MKTILGNTCQSHRVTSFCFFIICLPVLVFYCCFSKLPQMWLKPTQISEIWHKSYKPKIKVSVGLFPNGSSRRQSVSLPFPASGDCNILWCIAFLLYLQSYQCWIFAHSTIITLPLLSELSWQKFWFWGPMWLDWAP